MGNALPLSSATMSAYPLVIHRVEKPWGRKKLWPGFDDPQPDTAPIGEIIFGDKGDGALCIKYLFTAEKLSIQVHPDDLQAREAGYPSGKDEAWVILDAEDGATIGLGLKHDTSREALEAAAREGSLESLLDLRPVKAGDVIYSPAGTIHAIGAGITLLEVQQNVDLTYRLYDYGRPRPLHLDAGLTVAVPGRHTHTNRYRAFDVDRIILCEGGMFVLERWTWNGARNLNLPERVSGWFAPLQGSGTVDGAAFAGGECWRLDGSMSIEMARGSECLFAYPLPDPLPLFG